MEAYERLVSLLLRRGAVGSAFGYAERARARALLDRLGENDRSTPSPLTAAQVQESLAEAGRPMLLVEYFACLGELIAFGVRAGGDVEARGKEIDKLHGLADAQDS